MEVATGRRLHAHNVEWEAHWGTLSIGKQWEKEAGEARALETWMEGLLPENGKSVVYRENAERRFEEQGLDWGPIGPMDLMWGNPGTEYPGSVITESWSGDEPIKERWNRQAGERTNEVEIGHWLLQRAAYEEGRGRLTAEDFANEPSLSGMRTKQGLQLGEDGQWRWASPEHLSTHVVKREQALELPSEAQTEAVCQRTLGILGIEAAKTMTRVFGGCQVIISQRMDRRWDRGQVRTVHVEDWCQMAGLRPAERHQEGGKAGWGSPVPKAIPACTGGRSGGTGHAAVTDAVRMRVPGTQ